MLQLTLLYKRKTSLMRTLSLAIILFFNFNINAQNGSSCIDSNPFCSDQSYNFPNNSSGSSATSGPDYGCLFSQPNPIWYHLKIGQSGPIQLDISQSNGDIDFAMWGPFPNLPDGCNEIMSGNLSPLQCSYSASSTETIGIGMNGGYGGGQSTPADAQAGEFYIVILTNYSGGAGDISLEQTSGGGNTDCSILVPCDVAEVTATPSACDDTDNTFSVSGEVTFSEEPTTGTLIVEDCNGNSSSYSAPFTSPISYTITGVTADGANCNVEAYFSDETACSKVSADYQNPVACCVPPDLTINTLNKCIGDDIQLDAAIDVSSDTATTSFYTSSSDAENNINSINSTVVDEGSFWVRAEVPGNSNCFNVFEIVVNNYSLPAINAGMDTTICKGDIVNLQASGAVDYSWNNGINDGESFSPNSTTTYTVTGTDANGCINTDQVQVIVNPTPDASFTADPMVTGTSNPQVDFTNTSTNANGYIWEFGDGSPTLNETNLSHTFSDQKGQNYTVTLIALSSGNCIDTVRNTIRIETELIFYIPNAFTPDNDSYNETFQPVFTSGYDPTDFQMLIYNRWGELVFESHNAAIGWDGTYSGKVVKEGPYLWKIEFKETMSDKRHYEEGHINLIR